MMQQEQRHDPWPEIGQKILIAARSELYLNLPYLDVDLSSLDFRPGGGVTVSVATDGEGKPLHAAMLYTDPRGKEQCARLRETLGGKEIARITGLRPHEMYSISKLMWLRENRPEIYGKAAYVFLMEDYVVYHLTGVRQIDYSLATRTMAFDITSLTWSREIPPSMPRWENSSLWSSVCMLSCWRLPMKSVPRWPSMWPDL